MNSPIVTSSRSVDRELAEHAARIITDVVERVFASAAAIRDVAVQQHRAAVARGEPMCERDIEPIRDLSRTLLARTEIEAGMGMIMAPGLLPAEPLRLEWWQRDPNRPSPVWLDVDLNPASVDFYDYVAAEWFAVPRTTGRRHVTGPYVDVYGTDGYQLTLTMPVIDDGEFLGVTGADVPVARFETHILRRLGSLCTDLVVVNSENRVVLSSSPRWLAGSLMTPDHAQAPRPALALELAEPSWQLLVV
ncbi:cache domain-containing protein [Mycolicibacterium agri]|uniref:Cache domain-containing protein n=1 Tax=Mycolicibacterium agri TaxID=36811 RepID=A0A7I9VZK7_MYCAG|nr:cache domain-containing protein [Mycolicibacterium agri]GFG50891.1 hypothetical protein MAGR_23320 [Mycolicibacterium agri]